MNGKKVFISYSHDSDEHCEQVLALSERLRRDGIETLLGQYIKGAPQQGWSRWMLDHFDAADFVLVVCTQTYCRRFRGHEAPGKGADWEGALITQEIYDRCSRTLKFVPILLSPAVEDWIPEPLRSVSHYALTSEAGYQRLYDFLLAQSGVRPHPVGTPRIKPRRQGTPMTFIEPESSGALIGKPAHRRCRFCASPGKSAWPSSKIWASATAPRKTSKSWWRSRFRNSNLRRTYHDLAATR